MLKEINGNIFKSDKTERYLFESQGIDLEQLNSNEIANTVNQVKVDLNNRKIKETFKFYNLSTGVFFDSSVNSSVDSLLFKESNKGVTPFLALDDFFSDPDFSNDYCKANGIYYRFISIKPDEGALIDFNDLTGMGEYYIACRKIDTRISKNMVNGARKMTHANLYKLMADIEGIEVYSQNEEMLKKIVKREEELFKVSFVFVVRAVSELELFDETQNLLTKLSVAGLSPRISTFSQNEDWVNFVPGLYVERENDLIFHTSLLANCLPVHRDKIHSEGIEFKARSGASVFFNSRKGDSFSTLVTGVTGMGKTFLVQKMMTYELEMGRAIFIIDPKTDYETFALLNDFEIIDQDINPMIFKDAIYLRDMILSMMPPSDRAGKFSGLLLKKIRETKAHELDCFFEALKKLEEVGLTDLSLYFEVLRDRVSSNPLPESGLPKRVYVLSSTFTDDTLPFLLVYAFEYLKRIKGQYRFVIDEAHRIMVKNALFLSQRIREVRVKKSGLVIISQSKRDFVADPKGLGRVLADNCEHEMHSTQDTGGDSGFNIFDSEMINSLHKVDGKYSEFYYKSSTCKKVIRYFPTPKEFEVFRSGEEEQERILKYINWSITERGLTVDQSINSYVREVSNVI